MLSPRLQLVDIDTATRMQDADLHLPQISTERSRALVCAVRVPLAIILFTMSIRDTVSYELSTCLHSHTQILLC